jgi:subtilisin family serine protease
MVDPKSFGYTGRLLDLGNRPILQVPYKDAEPLKTYQSASVDFTRGTVVGGLAPTVAYFSSRGPSLYYPAILKPDVMAPGVNILAGKPYEAGDGAVHFWFMSGTSQAVPHVSGAAILLKSLHSSPAAIK